MAEHVERAEAHPQSPSAKWAKFQAGMAEHALRSAAKLAEREHERTDATQYHHDSEQPNEGAPHA